MGKLKMGEKTNQDASVVPASVEQVVKIRHEIIEKPVYEVVSKEEIIEKPFFVSKLRETVVEKPVYEVKEHREVISKPVFEVKEEVISVEKRQILEKVSLAIHKPDWVLRILLGISAAVHLWSTLK